MKNKIKFKIDNPENFTCGLRSFVEMSVDFTDCSFDPSNLKTDYFGSFEGRNFIIYHRNVDIEITGQLIENELTVNFNFPCRWNYLFDVAIFSIVGASIMIDINNYLGLAVIIFVVCQKIFVMGKEAKKKIDFIHQLRGVLDRIKKQ